MAACPGEGWRLLTFGPPEDKPRPHPPPRRGTRLVRVTTTSLRRNLHSLLPEYLPRGFIPALEEPHHCSYQKSCLSSSDPSLLVVPSKFSSRPRLRNTTMLSPRAIARLRPAVRFSCSVPRPSSGTAVRWLSRRPSDYTRREPPPPSYLEQQQNSFQSEKLSWWQRRTTKLDDGTVFIVPRFPALYGYKKILFFVLLIGTIGEGFMRVDDETIKRVSFPSKCWTIHLLFLLQESSLLMLQRDSRLSYRAKP